jgi:RAB protein geranylgeranyltransferase component A
MDNNEKLVWLRAKTDRELLVLIIHELEQTLSVKAAGVGQGSETCYGKFVVLLLKTLSISCRERARIERKLKELRSDLIAFRALRKAAACSD